jgi:transketolase
MIVARTIKGKGVPPVEDKNGWHGRALSEEYEKQALAVLELPESMPHLRVRAPKDSSGNTERAKTSKTSEARIAPPNYKIGDQRATRAAYGTALAKLGQVEPLVIALDGDVKNSTHAQEFEDKLPDRFIQSYIAEQNMVGAAVGLQSRGKIPFAATFACFFSSDL